MSTSLPAITRFLGSKQKLAVGLGVLLAIILPLIVRDTYWQHEIILVLWFAYVAACWNIISGYTRQVSLCHASFVGLGAYTSVILFNDFGITPWIGMFAGVVVAVLVSLVVGYPTLRLSGTYFVMGSFGVLVTIKTLFDNMDIVGPITIGGVDGLSVPLRGQDPAVFQFMDKEPYYYIILLMLAAVMYFTYWMQRSKWGFYLRAIRGDVDASHSLGINVHKYKVMTFAISAAFAALGGSFYAQFVLFIEPARILNWPLAFEMLLITMVGGRGTLWGPLLGSIILTPIAEIVRTTFGGGIFAGVHLLIWGILVILIVFFMPKGALGLIQAGYRRLQTRLQVGSATSAEQEVL